MWYRFDDKPLQVLWTHSPHWSHNTLGSFCLTALLQIPHGYFGLRGPGFSSMSPASSKHNANPKLVSHGLIGNELDASFL